MNQINFIDAMDNMDRYHRSLYRQSAEKRLMVLGCSLSEARTILGLRAKSRVNKKIQRAIKRGE